MVGAALVPSRPLAREAALAVVVTVGLGLVVGTSARPALVALAATAAIASILVALSAPRLALVAGIAALVSYVPDVVGHGALAIASTAVPVLVAFAVLARNWAGVERVAWPAAAPWFVGFGVALMVAFAFAGDRVVAMSELTDYAGFAALALVMLVLITDAPTLRRAMWAVAGALAVLALLAVVQQVTKTYGRTFGGLATVTEDADAMRSSGPLSANYFAEVLAAGAPLALYLGLSARERGERLLAFAAAALMVWALVYTLSRGAFAAVVVAAVLAAVLRRVRLALFATLVAVAVVGGVTLLPATMKERVAAVTGAADGTRPADSSLRGRLGENLAAVEMFRDHPLTGVGPDNFELRYAVYSQRVGLDPRPEVRGAHSLYLESLAETGLVGTIAFVALLVAALRSAWTARARLRGTDQLLAEGCLVALVSFLVCAATLHLTYPRYLWIFVTLTFAARRLVTENAS